MILQNLKPSLKVIILLQRLDFKGVEMLKEKQAVKIFQFLSWVSYWILLSTEHKLAQRKATLTNKKKHPLFSLVPITEESINYTLSVLMILLGFRCPHEWFTKYTKLFFLTACFGRHFKLSTLILIFDIFSVFLQISFYLSLISLSAYLKILVLLT